MNGVIAFLAFVISVAILLFVPTLAAPYASQYGPVTVFHCGSALLLCGLLAAIVGVIIRREPSHGAYLLKLFLLALLIRIMIGAAIFAVNAQDFFGGDAWTYDFTGQQQLLAWSGDKFAQLNVDRFVGKSYRSGWGMVSMVAVIYGMLGRNMLAVQFVNAVLGAATAPVIFLAAKQVFNNRRVAEVAGIAVGFYPSLVLWSSQGLKDGPIVLFLALTILATIKLGQKLSGPWIAVLVFSLLGVLAFRFYVFYMLLVAVVAAFVIGMREVTVQSLARQLVVVVLLALSLTYFGVTRYANIQVESYADFEQLQRTRHDAARSAQSGFGRDVDVSTATGALTTIPMGMVYLLFAPFPWQLGSLRQSLTLPEMVIWWAAFPLLILGIWFSIKYRLRQMSPILIFTSMLTLAYSVFQGNVGTAYRQRAQVLVFYFIFVAVGAVLMKEKREEKRKRNAEELRAASVRIPRRLIKEPSRSG
ncbi:MAG: glycosyltransferase family 39 protein [Pyrinomonadaceae bacterium]